MRPVPGKIEITTKKPATIPTPPLRFPTNLPPKNPTLPPREVLFSGQAFDIKPTRQPQNKRPDVFDLTVSVQQNFGGQKKKPQIKYDGEIL